MESRFRPFIHQKILGAQAAVVDEKGLPFPMRVPNPRAFALHKAWLSGQPTRKPLKRPCDIEQARAIGVLRKDALVSCNHCTMIWKMPVIHPVEIIYGRVSAREIAEVLTWAKARQEWLARTFEELQR